MRTKEMISDRKCQQLISPNAICFFLCFQEMYGVKPRKKNLHYFVSKSLGLLFLSFHKMLTESALNFLSTMMYVSSMRPSLVFMYSLHVCSAVRPPAQWLLGP